MSKTGSVYTKSQGRQREIEMERKSVDSTHGESAELVLDVRYWKDKRCLKLRRKSEIIS